MRVNFGGTLYGASINLLPHTAKQQLKNQLRINYLQMLKRLGGMDALTPREVKELREAPTPV